MASSKSGRPEEWRWQWPPVRGYADAMSLPSWGVLPQQQQAQPASKQTGNSARNPRRQFLQLMPQGSSAADLDAGADTSGAAAEGGIEVGLIPSPKGEEMKRWCSVLCCVGVLSAILSVISVASNTVAAHALNYNPCPTGNAGFFGTFWNPYDDASVANLQNDTAAEGVVGVGLNIVDWTLDADAGNDTAYPNGLGYPVFNDFVDHLFSALPSGAQVWMGLSVAPNSDAANDTNWSYLMGKLALQERLADDLYAKYGSRFLAWEVPDEPGENVVSTYNNSYQYGAYLQQLDDYLHTHDGNKPVAIAPAMPSAANVGLTPLQFVQQMQPMMQIAHMDVWNLQDGFGMTGWTTAQEVAGFQQADAYVAQYGGYVDADVYTPTTSRPSAFEPYLQALAPYVTTLTEWEFPEYLNPWNYQTDPNAQSDFLAYRDYCDGY